MSVITSVSNNVRNALTKHATLAIILGIGVIHSMADEGSETKESDALTKSQANSNSLLSYVNLWTGAKVENPYSISVDPTNSFGTLNSGETKTDGYIELGFSYTFVRRSGKPGLTDEQRDPFIWGANESHRTKNSPGHGHFVAPWVHFPDFDTGVGYVFRDSDAPTNFSSSTIVGGADLYAWGTLGFPWWRYVDNGEFVLQSTFEISGGFVTDKDNLLLHPSIFIGGGLQGAYYRGEGNDKLVGYWTGRIGMAQIDRPRLDPTGANVLVNARNEPEFDAEWSPSLGFAITFPITKTLSAQFNGNTYFTDSPASWNLSVGVVIDIDRFFNALK